MRCSCLRVMRLYMVLMSFLWSSYSDTVIWRERRFHSVLLTRTWTNAPAGAHTHAQSAHIRQAGLQLYNLLGLLRGVVCSQHAQQTLHQGLVCRQDLRSTVTSVLIDERSCDIISNGQWQGWHVAKWTAQQKHSGWWRKTGGLMKKSERRLIGQMEEEKIKECKEGLREYERWRGTERTQRRSSVK